MKQKKNPDWRNDFLRTAGNTRDRKNTEIRDESQIQNIKMNASKTLEQNGCIT